MVQLSDDIKTSSSQIQCCIASLRGHSRCRVSPIAKAGHAGAERFAAIEVHDTLITIGTSDTILLSHVSPAALTAHDCLFG
jgi:hypothetical protein